MRLKRNISKQMLFTKKSYTPCHRGDPELSVGWTHLCRPNTAGSGPCATAQTWGASLRSWTWPEDPSTSLHKKKSQHLSDSCIEA